MKLFDGTAFIEDFISPSERMNANYRQVCRHLRDKMEREAEARKLLEESGYRVVRES